MSMSANVSPNPTTSPSTVGVTPGGGVPPYQLTEDAGNPSGITITPAGGSFEVHIPATVQPPAVLNFTLADSDTPPDGIQVQIQVR